MMTMNPEPNKESKLSNESKNFLKKISKILGLTIEETKDFLLEDTLALVSNDFKRGEFQVLIQWIQEIYFNEDQID